LFREPIPFEQVKEKIKEEIRTARLKTELQKQVESLKNDYHLKLHLDKLKAGSV
jgi:ribosome assembly protein YihI (activator of Der GTPase)